MPAADTRSRTLFSQIKITLSNAIGDIYEQELALRRKPGATAADQARIATLFQKRVELQDLIPAIREAEIAYLASPQVLEQARRALNDATRHARAQARQLQRTADIIANATLIAGTIRNLVGTLRGVRA